MTGSDEDQQKHENVKRPILSKYATTTHSEKFAPVLTGDFDKNLTIEKAKFDSPSGSSNIQQQQPIPSSSTPAALVSPSTQNVEESTTKSPPLTTSVTLPIVNTIQSLSGPTTPTTASMISAMPSQSTPLLNKSKPKVEVKNNFIIDNIHNEFNTLYRIVVQ